VIKKLIALTLVLLVTAILWLKLQPKTVEGINVGQGNLSQTIVATGRIAPMAKIELASLVMAQVDKVYVREGDLVTAGQPLVSLSDAGLDANLRQAQANLIEAEQRIDELKQLTRPLTQTALEQAKANLTLAEADYQRYARMQQQQLASQSSLDNAKRTLDVNLKAYESAQMQWQATQPTGSSSQLLQTRLKQAQAALAIAEAKKAQLTIQAPTSGTVIQKLVEVGTTVQSGKTILILAGQGETRIEVPIDEKSLRFLATDQKARVIADAYPNQPFDAQLNLIYPSIDPNRATVNIRFIVPQPPAFLRPEMTVSIEMTTGQAINALIVPSDAIREAKSQTPWVMKVDQGRTVKQAVTLGIKGVGNTQILSGVTLDDWLVTQADIPLGAKVNIKPRTQPYSQ
jgi:HlyD family secretion protein